MAEKKNPTLIIEIDLGCQCCYKKIQKVLCKLQVREKIQSISYDEKKNKVTISGPFDPDSLKRKLRCKLCKLIKDIKLKPDDPPKPAPKPEPKPEPKPDPKPKPEPEPCKPGFCHKPWPDCCFRPCPCYEPSQGCRRCCSCGWMLGIPAMVCVPPPKPCPLAPKPICCNKPWPSCCYKPCPCYDSSHGSRRCCSCGWMCCIIVSQSDRYWPNPCRSSNPCPPQNPCCHGYKFVCEDEPSPACNIM